MKRINLKKIITIFGVSILSLSLLAACSKPPSDDRSTPEVAIENYMATVKTGEIEKLHGFMDELFLKTNTLYKTGGINISDEWESELKELDAYKEYQKELKSKYQELSYEIVDSKKRDDIGQMEFTISLTMPDINKVNEEVIDKIVESHLIEILSSENEEDIYDGFSQMYKKSTQALKDSDDMIEAITGNITFTKGGGIDSDAGDDWLITEMDAELFNRLADDKELWLKMPNVDDTAEKDSNVVTVPDIDFTTTEKLSEEGKETGKAFDPADYKDKNVIITFTNSNCPYCDDQSLVFEELKNEYDFEMFYIPTKETSIATSNALDELGISNYELIIDRGNYLFDALDVGLIPTSIIKSKAEDSFKVVEGVIRGDSEGNGLVLSDYID